MDRDEPVGFLGYLVGFLVVVLLWSSPATAVLWAVLSAKNRTGVSNLWYLLPLAVLPPAIFMAAAWIKDRTGRKLLMPVGVPLALAVSAGIIALAAIAPGQVLRRCVDVRTMTVAAPQACQGHPAPGINEAQYLWYYGGSGTEEDEPARGGSFTPPGQEPGSRSGVSNEGDDG
jgi:hypothetical protein